MANSDMVKQFYFSLGLHMPSLKKSLEQGEKAVEDFTSKSKRILAGFGIGAGAGLFGKLVTDYVSLGNKLQSFSDSTGITVEGMTKIGMALERFGGNTETAMNTFQGLQQAMRDAVDWGTGPLMTVMGKYGFSLYNQQGRLKDTRELYLSIADTMQRLTKSQQIDMGRSLGLDEHSIRMLQTGRQNVEALIASRSGFGAMTSADTKVAKEFNNAIVDAKQLLVGFGRQVARAALPVIKKFVEYGKGILKAWDENKGVILGISNVISHSLVPAFVGGLVRIGNAMAPFLLKMAPLTAIALLIDDIAVFMRNDGGRSILGDILGDKGDGVRKALNNVFSSLGGIFKGLLTGDFKGAFEEAKRLWNEGIVPLAKIFGEALCKAWDNFIIYMKNETFIGAWINAFWETIDEFVDWIRKETPFGSHMFSTYQYKGKKNVEKTEVNNMWLKSVTNVAEAFNKANLKKIGNALIDKGMNNGDLSMVQKIALDPKLADRLIKLKDPLLKKLQNDDKDDKLKNAIYIGTLQLDGEKFLDLIEGLLHNTVDASTFIADSGVKIN